MNSEKTENRKSFNCFAIPMSPKIDSLSEAHFNVATYEYYFRGDNGMSKQLNDLLFAVFSEFT